MATAIAERLKLTYADSLRFPEDGRRHEIVDGEHFVTAAPDTRHQSIVVNLTVLLGALVRRAGLGRLLVAPYDLVLSSSDVVQPDLLFFSTARAAAVTAQNAQGAPDLVVEILSPSSRRLDESTKLELYERAAVAEYWLVDPELETVKVYRREGDLGFAPPRELALERREGLTSPLLPGLALDLADVFAQ